VEPIPNKVTPLGEPQMERYHSLHLVFAFDLRIPLPRLSIPNSPPQMVEVGRFALPSSPLISFASTISAFVYSTLYSSGCQPTILVQRDLTHSGCGRRFQPTTSPAANPINASNIFTSFLLAIGNNIPVVETNHFLLL
jgi:hypothetical protein